MPSPPQPMEGHYARWPGQAKPSLGTIPALLLAGMGAAWMATANPTVVMLRGANRECSRHFWAANLVAETRFPTPRCHRTRPQNGWGLWLRAEPHGAGIPTLGCHKGVQGTATEVILLGATSYHGNNLSAPKSTPMMERMGTKLGEGARPEEGPWKPPSPPPGTFLSPPTQTLAGLLGPAPAAASAHCFPAQHPQVQVHLGVTSCLVAMRNQTGQT